MSTSTRSTASTRRRPIEETLEALNDVVRAGKARYIGASSMFAWQFMKMLATSRANGWTPFVSMQPQYNLVYREEEREMLPLCLDQGVGVIPWSPLARGFLAGGRAQSGRRQYRARPNRRVRIAALLPRRRLRGCRRGEQSRPRAGRLQHAGRPGLGPEESGDHLADHRRVQGHHLYDAIGALTISLDDEEVKTLEAPYRPKPVLDHG